MNVNSIAESAGASGGEKTRFSDPVISRDGYGIEPPPPLVRIRSEHNVSRRDIDADALRVLQLLSRNNFIAYLVGGGVRDLLLGRKPKDFDISTDARPEQIRALFRNCILIGRRFRLAHIRFGDKVIETSTFRRTPETTADPNDPEVDLFQRDDNLFGSPREDALRRDFTVNGLFYDIKSFSIIDYVGGMDDLAARRIRSIGDPCIRFREDPVRMLRAVRFASRLDFELDGDARDAIVKHGDELAKAAPARLLEEITRLFAFSSGEKAIRLLHSTGLLKVILPEMEDALPHGGNADSDALWRRLRVLDEGDTVLPDATPALIFSVLLLDALRMKIGRDWRDNDIPRLKFDRVHAFLEPLSQRLRFPRRLVDRIVHIYLAQHRFAQSGGKRGSIANFVTQDSFHEALALAEIIRAAAGSPKTELNHWRDMLAERISGREEGRGQEDRRQAQSRPGHTPPVSGNAEAGPQEIDLSHKKLSRSARRRRNKKIRRQRHQEDLERQNAGACEPVADPEAAAASDPAVAETPTRVAIEPSQKEREGDGENPSRGKGRRKNQRRRESANSAAEGVSEPLLSAIPPAKEPKVEEFRPLTAAVFYTPSEPEKRKPGSRKKSAQKKAGNETGNATDNADPTPIREKPLPMDRADEADIPLHWLDEI